MRTQTSPSALRVGRTTNTARLLAAAAFAMIAPSVLAQSITNLGVLDSSHQFSQGVAVSSDGQYVAGNSGREFFNQMLGFRWSRSNGPQDLGNPSGAANVTAMAINGDGSTIAGTCYHATSPNQAFRWTSGGMQTLSPLGTGDATSATGISSNGQFISGSNTSDSGDRAVRWNGTSSPQDLGVLSGGAYSDAWAISGDGTTVTGYSDSSSGERAFIWTEAGGMQELPGSGFTGGLAINADGSVIAGYFDSNAARWNSGTLQILDNLPGGSFSTAYSVSGNGLLVGGFSDSATSQMPLATIWSDALGVVDLNTYLPSLGVDLTGWQLTTTTGISFDGNTLVGVGTFDGNDRGWIVTIPAPGTAGLLGLSGLIAGRRRRAKHA
jgi:probable HAF family extracellular repeat protein